ncbi:methyltransferase domain-containing protein [Falsiroseomonas sp. HW251]|uniref:methyltransferase domain-containing protein n=1 Tax=Falsiroseomonas sp. HW251 TaxID=3390998 RepID=UPI003D322919
MEEQGEHPGHCPICDKDVAFRKGRHWRDLQCPSCKSQSRNRALWLALNGAFPRWRELAIDEGSPGWDPVSQRLVRECARYTATQFRDDMTMGSIVEDAPLPCKRYRVENLERQGCADGSFDLVVTQDVFEHIFDPRAAIAETARTLLPGGGTVLTVPVVRKFAPSQRRARLAGGAVQHLLPAQYHGNPVSSGGALVTIDWGYDIAAILGEASGMQFAMQTFEDPDLGIRDEWNQLLIGRKALLPSLA